MATAAPGGGAGGVLSLHATGINCNAKSESRADACFRWFMAEWVQGWFVGARVGLGDGTIIPKPRST